MRKVIRNELGMCILVTQRNTMQKSRVFCDKIEYVFEEGIISLLSFWQKNKLVFNVELKPRKYPNIKQAMKSVGMEIIPSVWDNAKTPKEKKLFMKSLERDDNEKTYPAEQMMKGTIPQTIKIEILPKNRLKVKDVKGLKQKLLETTTEYITSDADVEVIYDK